jgi:hypothetical protein
MFELFKSHAPRARRGAAHPVPPEREPAKPGPKTAEDLARAEADAAAKRGAGGAPKELGGPEGPEPTRYGDWERKGICYDF